MKHIWIIIAILAPFMCKGEKDYDCENRFSEFISSYSGQTTYEWFNGIGANDVIFTPETNATTEILEFVNSSNIGQVLNLSTCQNWLKSRLSDIEALKPGMTRSQIREVLTPNGGIQSYRSSIYSHKQCAFIKVRVEFREDSKKTFPPDGDDIVSEISLPYIGLVIRG